LDETINFNIPDGETLGSGLNIFVGENNSGKSTVFEAINFLKNGTRKKIDDLRNKKTKDNIFVELTFSGQNIDEVINLYSSDKHKSAFNKCVITDENGENQFTISKEEDDKIKIWDSETNKPENHSGIDAPIKKMFEIDFIWSDTNPEDIAKFGATNVCGKLLKSITKEFTSSSNQQWKKFQQAHKETFYQGEESLKSKVLDIEKRTAEIFSEQFGEAKIEFQFELPKDDSFFNNTIISIDDGMLTQMEDKGSGMQRSVALALLQVYSENLVYNPKLGDVEKPFFLFIDEPEICLHPQGQKKLLNALMRLSKSKQIFITTHSPYFITPELIGKVFRFENNNNFGASVFKCNNEFVVNKLQEKENKVFFFHHRDLFFSNKVLFVEGANDYKYYSSYCENSNLGNFVQYLYFLAGKDDWPAFKLLCDELNILVFFLFDLDVISMHSNTFKNQYPEIEQKIQNFGKEILKDPNNQDKSHPDKRKRCDNLLDENLSNEERKLKNEIIENLEEKNIFVLRSGSLENYFETTGDLIDNRKLERQTELNSIFNN